MRYDHVTEGIFLSRPNRFIAEVAVEGVPKTVHVKNTGRCAELLVPGCTVYLARGNAPGRKTEYDLIATRKERPGREALLINMDSQVVNDVAAEYLAQGHLLPRGSHIRREVTYGQSRFDFYLENGARKAFVEVKGVTLESEGVAAFPDAPTLRGVKHIGELERAVREGYEAYLLFIVQMKGVHVLRVNDRTHKAFGDAVRRAAAHGVGVLAVDAEVAPDRILPGEGVAVDLSEYLP